MIAPAAWAVLCGVAASTDVAGAVLDGPNRMNAAIETARSPQRRSDASVEAGKIAAVP